ncbi:MAG TPA: glutathione-disulfide reductase [Polyangiaceae bacterium]|jgi:glutathione reductase (NADPH)|nr:glutathione-disulfide reductase [Polyangiaceae bacterium]
MAHDTDSFDFIVLGAGSGGMAAARRAARHGAKVVLIEARKLGGTCVNTGCVPKKVMFNAANIAEFLQDAASYGFRVDRGKFDWAGLCARRDAYVSRLTSIYEYNLAKEGVELILGRGRVIPGGVEVGGRTLRAAHVLIATGGYPHVPEIPGAQLGVTSNGFFELRDLPKQAAVIGAGYIGVELAGILRSLGSRVSVFSRHHEVLPRFDVMLREQLGERMLEAGIELHRSQVVKRLSRVQDGLLKVTTEAGTEHDGFDVAVWAVGRAPASSGIGLDTLGVKFDAKGFIETDTFQNTNVPGVYAVGDVTGRLPLTPVAIAAGRRLADRLFGGEPDAQLDYENVPTVVFSHPPLATVGLSEFEAGERFGVSQVKVFSSRYTSLYHGVTERKPKSAVKLVTVGPEQRVVGLHAIGIGSDELVQGFAVALRLGATKRDFDRTVAVHPTAAEELVTLR